MSAYYLYNPPIPPPPPPYMNQMEYTGQIDRRPVGPVIGVLIMVGVLLIGSVLFGRYCSSPRRLRGRCPYDIESWVEDKCSSCIDGGVVEPIPLQQQPQPQPPAPQQPVAAAANNAASTSRQVREATASTSGPRTPPPRQEIKDDGEISQSGEPEGAQSEN